MGDPAIYALTSPMTTIKRAKTPTLIQHGEFDTRVPTPNANERLILGVMLARESIVKGRMPPMFPKFGDVLLSIEDLKDKGLIKDYAIFGAIAQLFWDEARPTFDLDVLILLEGGQGRLDVLGPLYEWARQNSYPAKGAHIVIGDVPVQFVPAPNALHEEAVRTAATLDFGGIPVRVVRPEYLIATWLQPPANNAERRERALRTRDSVKIDTDLLDDILQRYGLSW